MKGAERSAGDQTIAHVPLPDRNRDIAERTERLRQAAKKAGGNAAVARRAEMPLGTLNKYLAGRDMPVASLIRLAIACGVQADWLATGAQSSGSPHTGYDLPSAPSHIISGRGDISVRGDASPRLFSTVHIDKLAGALEAVADNFARNRVKAPMRQVVQAALLLYDIMNEPDFDPTKSAFGASQEGEDNE